MKLGLGLYRSLINDENLRFARQAGATHVVVHLVDYFKGASPQLQSGPATRGWGMTSGDETVWQVDELLKIRELIESHGLVWEAIENFDPAHWHDILLDGPRRAEQIERIKQIIRNVGQAGIPIIGYNFSIAGVWGWVTERAGRGMAVSQVYDESRVDLTPQIPRGMVWNMIYNPEAGEGTIGEVSETELWRRVEAFLREVLPVAEEAGVRLAAHPDDPPADRLRGTARLVNRQEKYRRLLDLVPSRASSLEFCLGSLQEMPGGDLYATVEHHARRGEIAYVHCRNVVGKVPHYRETFIDEGNIDMPRVLRILRDAGFDGVLIPDHTPQMDCAAPWHAGMAHSMGYLKAVMQVLEAGW